MRLKDAFWFFWFLSIITAMAGLARFYFGKDCVSFTDCVLFAAMLTILDAIRERKKDDHD